MPSVSTWLEVLTGGGVIAAVWRASAAVSDFRTALQLLADVLAAHLEHHPGPTPKEHTDASHPA